MTKPWRIMKNTESRLSCEDCEVIPAELWCDSCGIGLCRECDLLCHDPRGFACSHRRILLVGLSARKNHALSGSSESKNVSLITEAGVEVGNKDLSNSAASSPSTNRRKKKKKHVKGIVQICGQWQEAGLEHLAQPALDSTRPVVYENATSPSSSNSSLPREGTVARYSGTELEDLSTSDDSSLSSSPKAFELARSTSLPPSFKLKSAFKGSHEVQGLGPRPELHVHWAPGVQEPLSSLISHTVGHKRQSFRRTDQKHRHKGKYAYAHSSGRGEKSGKRKPKKASDPRAACPATSVVGKGVRRVEGRSGSTSALEVVDPRNGITNHDNSLDTEELSRRVNSKAHVLSSSSEDNCQSGERDDSQLTGEDTDNDIDSKHKRLPELPREMADSDGCALQSEISAIGNDSSKTLPKDSSKDALDTLKFLCARRVLPAVLVSSESTGVSTYSAKAVACMVHAACMVAEGDTCGALVEFEASARLFRLAEKMALSEISAESELAARHALNGQVVAWVSMSTLYTRSGNTCRAEMCQTSLVQACQQSQMKLEAGICLLDEGECQLQRGAFKEAHTTFETASALVERELQAMLEQQVCTEEKRLYTSQLREIFVKAGRLAGVAAFRSADFGAAKRLLLGTLVVARRLNLKAEEARCLRLLADLQKGSQHLSSLQAAADAMNSVDLPLERAEALYRLGSCKVTLHLSTLHSATQSRRDCRFLESAKRDLEEAVAAIRSLGSVGDDACTAREGQSVPLPDGVVCADESRMFHMTDEHAVKCTRALAECCRDEEYLGPSFDVLQGRLFEVLGRTCVLLGEFLEARTFFSLALRDKEWIATFQEAAKQVETLLDTLQWEDSRTCRDVWSAVGASIATGV